MTTTTWDEVRDALYQCHGLRAWSAAVECPHHELREQIIAHVRQIAGGLSMHYREPGAWQNSGQYSTVHVIKLCGVDVGTLTIDHAITARRQRRTHWRHTTRLTVSRTCSKALGAYLEAVAIAWLGKPDKPKGRPRWTHKESRDNLELDWLVEYRRESMRQMSDILTFHAV